MVTDEADELHAIINKNDNNMLTSAIILLVLGLLLLYYYVGAPLLVLSAYAFYRYWRRRTNFQGHSEIRELEGMEYVKNPLGLINSELKDKRELVGNLYCTDSFIMHDGYYSCSFAHFSQLVWVYNTKTTHKTNGLTTGTGWSVSICLSDGRVIGSSEVSEERANAVVKELALRVPFALFGYSDQLKYLWTKNRIVMLLEVDKRRELVLKNPSGEVAKWAKRMGYEDRADAFYSKVKSAGKTRPQK